MTGNSSNDNGSSNPTDRVLHLLIDYFEKKPKVIILIIVLLFVAVTAGYFGKSFFCEKIKTYICDINRKGSSDNLVGDAIINAIDVPVLIYIKTEKYIRVINANESALKYYLLSKEQINKKTPEELHHHVKHYMKNYSEWASEQTDRKVSAGINKKIGKTKIPMKLENHPNFSGKWFLTSNYFQIGKNDYILTRFSRTSDIP